MKRSYINAFVVIMLAISISGCSSEPKTPTYEGVFLVEGSNYIEIPESKGPPKSKNQNFVTANDNTPILYLNKSSVNLNLLTISNLETNAAIDFRIKALQIGVYEISFNNEAQDGVYCAVIGNPFLMLNDLPYWCFQIGQKSPEPAPPSTQSSLIVKTPPTKQATIPPTTVNTAPIEVYAISMEKKTKDEEPGWIYYTVSVGHRANFPMVIKEIPFKNGYVMTKEGQKYDAGLMYTAKYVDNEGYKQGFVQDYSSGSISYSWYDAVAYIPGINIIGTRPNGMDWDFLTSYGISFKVPEKLSPTMVYFDGLSPIDLTNFHTIGSDIENVNANIQLGSPIRVLNQIDVIISDPRIVNDDYRGNELEFDIEFQNNDITADQQVHIGITLIDEMGILYYSPSNVCGEVVSQSSLSGPVKVGPGQTLKVLACFALSNMNIGDGNFLVNLAAGENSSFNYVGTYKIKISPQNGGQISAEGTINPTSAQNIIVPSETPSSENPNLITTCPGSLPQRMSIGGHGYICTQEDRVILRQKPKRSAAEVTRLAPGTTFIVLDGPKCKDNWSWWQINTETGEIGWIAEGGDQYFICPVP